MKKGFTLIELLVVIAIIGVLAGVLLATMSGGRDSAATARCLSNLKSLSASWQSAAVDLGYYPSAGSFEVVKTSKGSSTGKEYFAFDGWVSWNSHDAYRKDSKGYYPGSHKASGAWNLSMYNSNLEDRQFSVTNGAIWKYTGGNHSVYLCPQHERVKKDLKPNWSYVMNAYFGWDYSRGARPISVGDAGYVAKRVRDFKNADKHLLFAEIQFLDDERNSLTSVNDTSGDKCDSILQYKECKGGSSPESIGFNHRNGRQLFAPVVFADGHVDKLIYPKDGLSETERQDLTKWLCTGIDVSFDGKKYEKMDN